MTNKQEIIDLEQQYVLQTYKRPEFVLEGGEGVWLVDSEGNRVGPGVEGDVEVRGPQVFDGYYDNDEENRKAFTADGFFRTGDLGKLTLGGELVLTGRSKKSPKAKRSRPNSSSGWSESGRTCVKT